MTDRIGFIGLGSLGGPVAHNIIDAGTPLMASSGRSLGFELAVSLTSPFDFQHGGKS